MKQSETFLYETNEKGEIDDDRVIQPFSVSMSLSLQRLSCDARFTVLASVVAQCMVELGEMDAQNLFGEFVQLTASVIKGIIDEMADGAE